MSAPTPGPLFAARMPNSTHAGIRRETSPGGPLVEVGYALTDADAALWAAAPDLLAVAQMWAEPLPYNPDEAAWSEPGDEALRATFNAELKRRFDATSAAIAKAVGKRAFPRPPLVTNLAENAP